MDSAETGRGPGAQLRAARLSLGIEVREICDALNLPASAIEAIERDEFDDFQAVVFARGYVRGYAKIVELDPVVVLASFPGRVDSTIETAVAPGAMSGGFPKVKVDTASDVGSEAWRRLRRLVEELYRDNPVPLIAAAGIGVLLLLALFIWALSGGSEPELELRPLDGAAAAAAEQAFAAVPSPALAQDDSPFASISATGSGPGSTVPSADNAELASSDLQTTAGALARTASGARVPAQPQGTATAAVSRASGAEEVVSEQLNAGNEELVLNFSADCWVDIKSSAGRALYSNLGRAATELRLRGSGPFQILLGYAPGVSLAFNGDDVSLAPHTRNNVARLVIGQ